MYKHRSWAAFTIKLTTGSGNTGTCEKLHDRRRIRIQQKAGLCSSAVSRLSVSQSCCNCITVPLSARYTSSEWVWCSQTRDLCNSNKPAVAKYASASSNTENELCAIHYCKFLLCGPTDCAQPNEVSQTRRQSVASSFRIVNIEPVQASKSQRQSTGRHRRATILHSLSVDGPLWCECFTLGRIAKRLEQTRKINRIVSTTTVSSFIMKEKSCRSVHHRLKLAYPNPAILVQLSIKSLSV